MAHIPKIPQRDDEPRAADGPFVRPRRHPPEGPDGPMGDDPRGRGPFGGPPQGGAPEREPVLMLPGPVVAMLALITAIQCIRSFLTTTMDQTVLLWFAFIPARYGDLYGFFPGGVFADAWTFVTYALLHGSWVHLITNAIWLVAFGSAVARRFGALRFWLFSAVAAAGGVALHLAVHFGEPVPVVGASAAIAGLMAAAARFVFDTGGPLVLRRSGEDWVFRRPARSLRETLRNRSALVFIVLWFAINFIIGVGSSISGGMSIAWEAHVGGFLVGLLLFRAFDPVPPR